VQASEITDEKTLKARLEARPAGEQRKFALGLLTRNAMRQLPVYALGLDQIWVKQHGATAIMFLRALLTAYVSCHDETEMTREASRRAERDLYAVLAAKVPEGEEEAVRGIIHEIFAARLALTLAQGASIDGIPFEALGDTPDSPFYTAISLDAQRLEEGHSVITHKLWPPRQRDDETIRFERVFMREDEPIFFSERMEQLRTEWEERKEFLFWLRWYQSALAGHPLTGDWESHWKLLTEIALIPDTDWEQGAEHVAGLIERIEERSRPDEAEQLAEALPLAESVEIDPETGLFHAVPIPLQNAPLVGQVLARVQDALDDALQGNNGLSERSRESRVITRVATRFGNDPQRIEMDFTSIAVGLRRQFEVEDLPRTEDNLALCDAVEEGVRAIRATHPEVAENRRILAGQAMAEMSCEDRELLAEATPLLAAISDAELAQDFTEDTAEILAPSLPGARRFDPGGKAPALPGVTEAERLFSRVAKIALSKQLGDAVLKVDGSATYKGARIIATIHSLVSLGIKLFGVIRPFL